MRPRNVSNALLLLVFVLAGCASSQGFDRGRLDRSLAGEKAAVTDDEIQRILALKPQLTFPFRLGIFLKGYESQWGRTWSRLEGAGHAESEEWVRELKEAGIVSDVIVVSPLTVGAYDLKNIRMGAARHGVDAVLVVESASDVDRYNNVSALLYWTIVGAYLVPGTHADALVIVKGALWDVRNEYLYLTVSSEGEARKIGPAFVLENSESIRIARDEALAEFGKEVVRRLKTMRGTSPGPRVQPSR